VTEERTVIASVDGEELTLEILRDSFGIVDWDQMSRDEQRTAINQWINLTIMANLAKKDDDLHTDKTLRFMADNASKRVYANAIISKRLNSISISEEDLYNFYRLRQAEFVESVREYRVQRLFFRTEENMQRVRRMLDNREIRFDRAASIHSEESIGRNGGFMAGYVTKAGADSLLWRELNTKDKFGEVTMRYGNGWIIARYYDHREGTANISFYDVKEDIERMMKDERRSDVYELLLREARLKAKIVIEY
jgi:hypothetical protein